MSNDLRGYDKNVLAMLGLNGQDEFSSGESSGESDGPYMRVVAKNGAATVNLTGYDGTVITGYTLSYGGDQLQMLFTAIEVTDGDVICMKA